MNAEQPSLENSPGESRINYVQRAIAGAILGGIVGWISLHLTVGMVLARNFDLAYADRISKFWWFACVAAGGVSGISIHYAQRSTRIRYVAWGAVASLFGLMLMTQIQLSRWVNYERQTVTIPGIRLSVYLEDIALISAPAALIVGGAAGYFLYPLFHRNKADPSLSALIEAPGNGINGSDD